MHQISKVSLPRGVNVAAPSSGSGQCRPRAGNSLKLSNFDLNGRVVRKGCVVSYGGLRLGVIKVRMGFLIGRKVSFGVVSGRLYPRDLRLKCESVQVVA